MQLERRDFTDRGDKCLNTFAFDIPTLQYQPTMGYVRYVATSVQCTASKEYYTLGEQITPIVCINQPYRNNIEITGCVYTLAYASVKSISN